MKKKDIGLLSLSNAENYGAVLQCYSLYCCCKTISNDVAVINYWPEFMDGKYRLFWIDNTSIRKMISSFKYSVECLPYTLLKKIRFCRFRQVYLNNLPILKKKKLKDEYKAYIVGSDQVWNLDITKMDKTFFLEFVEDYKKKNTYAASLGVEKYKKVDENIVINYLKTFNRISIREKSGCEYLVKLNEELKISNHIDPVFLTTSEEWKKLCKRRNLKKKYILIYAFENVDLSINIAKKISKSTSLDIIMIRADKHKFYESVRCYRSVGPREFLTLIAGANYVITDSFHGTAFSIIFNKQFYTIPFKGTNSRIENILNKFNCIERLITSIEEVDLSKEINYADYTKILNEEKIKSIRYLEEIIEGEI